MIRCLFLTLIALMVGLYGVELPGNLGKTQSSKKESSEPTEGKGKSLVSILCYHDFTEEGKATEMRLRKNDFKQQLETISQSGVPVISYEDFIAWKKGEKNLPPQCILITIDDGWRSVYEVAYPILKQYKFPFACALYKDYVNGGRLALTTEMIGEMMQNGMSIMSHSVSHPFPSKIKKQRKLGNTSFQTFLRKEIGSSKTYFEQKFSQRVGGYVYPGGFFTQEMFAILREFGYDHAFTVKPAKVSRDTNPLEIPRYVVLGTTDRSFRFAMEFPMDSTSLGTNSVKTNVPVFPKSGQYIVDRRPEISVSLNSITDLDPESLSMTVSGFGKVPASFDSEKKTFSWNVNRPLRSPKYSVSVTYRKNGAKRTEVPIRWSFGLDFQTLYQKELSSNF